MPVRKRELSKAALLVLTLAGCNALLGVEPLRSGPDASNVQQHEFANLAADGGEFPHTQDASDGGLAQPVNEAEAATPQPNEDSEAATPVEPAGGA